MVQMFVMVDRTEKVSSPDAVVDYCHALRDEQELGLFKHSVENLLHLNANGIYLFQESEEETNHIFWIYSDVRRHEEIPQDEWVELSGKPELQRETNTVLSQAFLKAKDFWEWPWPEKGFVVNGDRGFGMEKGDFVFGPKVSYPNRISCLVEAIETGSQVEVEEWSTFLASEFIHEFVHRQRGHYVEDGILMGPSRVAGEVPTHLAQALFEPESNGKFFRSIEADFESIAKASQKGEGERLGVYERAGYLAMLIIGDRLQQIDMEFAEAWRNDIDPHKIDSLKRVRGIGPGKVSELKAQLMSLALETDVDDLLAEVRDIQKKHGIVPLL